MTLAVSARSSSQSSLSQTVPVVVLGTDALLAALPATPVQLAHACLRAGFSNVIPASWGDELIAAAVLRRLTEAGQHPAVQCSCPIVAHRLLSVGGDLRPVLIATVAPPVAVARYVRTMAQPVRTRITYVGACPGAVDDSIDIRMSPDALMAMLLDRGILLDEQPRVFESIIPPDRRRFRSLPGGVPSADALWSGLGARSLVELEGEDLAAELAQHLLTGKPLLVDAAARVGCVCAGAVAAANPRNARATVAALEPPRATTPVVEELAPIDLDLPIPAAPRNPVDVAAVPPAVTASPPPIVPAAAQGGDLALGRRTSPVRGMSIVEPRPTRTNSPITPRPVLGALPIARHAEGKAIPRAYVARRRASPKNVPAVPHNGGAREQQPASPAAGTITATPIVDATGAPARRDAEQHLPTALLPFPMSVRQIVYVLIAIVAIALSVSTVVGVIVARALNPAPSVAPPPR